MQCIVHPLGALKEYKYVVILSTYQGKLLLSRQSDRNTWEPQGGHIEAGETPLEAARRELYEESGAEKFDITPVFDYRAGETEGEGANGMVFRAEIHALGALPPCEMAEVSQFEALPANITYPEISPVLLTHAGLEGFVYTIRPATSEDALGMTLVNVYTWLTAYRGLMPEDELYGRTNEVIRRSSSLACRLNAGNRCLVALVRGVVVGLASFGDAREGEATEGEVYSLYVLSGFQGLGIGRALLNGCKETLKSENKKALIINCLKGNPALFFYQAMGGVCVGMRKDNMPGGYELEEHVLRFLL